MAIPFTWLTVFRCPFVELPERLKASALNTKPVMAIARPRMNFTTDLKGTSSSIWKASSAAIPLRPQTYERDVLQDMTDGIQGLLIGDKEFIKPFLKQELAEHEIDLQTPLRKNMTDTRPNSFVAAITVGATPRRNSDRSID